MNPSPTGIYLPENPTPDISAFETPPVTSRFEGGALETAQTLASGPTIDLFQRASELLTRAIAPGKFLSANDYKNSPYFREGLNFPGGVSENVARLRANEYDQNAGINEELNNMPDGLTSSITKFAGATLGWAADPINRAAGYAVEKTIGTKAASLLNNLAQKPLLQRAATVGVGAVEGAAITAPQALSQYDAADQLGEDPSVASIFATMGLGAGLGGVIRGAIGVRSPVTVEADQMAKQVAVNQLATGKSVHVDEILQNGYNEARNSEPTINPDELLAHENNLKSQLDTTTQSISDEQKNLNNLLSAQKEALPNTAINSTDLANRVVSIFQKPTALRNADEQGFLNNLPKTDEVQNLTQAAQKPASSLDENDQQVLQSFQNNQETNLLKNRIDQHDKDIEELKNNLESTQNAKSIKNLQAQIDEIENKRSVAQNRLSEINNLNEEPAAIKKSRQQLNDLSTQKSNLEHEIYKNRALMAMNKDAVPPLESSQIKNASDYMRSYKSDSAINEAQDKLLTDELKGMPDDPTKDLTREEEQLKALEKDGILDDEDKAKIAQVREYDSHMNIFSKALKATLNCLKEG